MTTETRITFVDQFVNAVYGIILGYGFSNAMRDIKDGVPESVGPVFSSFSVIFTIIVLCMYWWDWHKLIGRKVESNAREFAIDMAILVSLEALFFVYEYPILYGFVFFFLSLLSLLWVVNYHFVLSKKLQYSNLSRYVSRNPRVGEYFLLRILGVGLYSAYLIVLYLAFKSEYISYSWVSSELWKGNWIELFILIMTFYVHRKYLFKPTGGRPGIEESVRPPHTEDLSKDQKQGVNENSDNSTKPD